MPLAVDVIEPRAALGGGVAYSALDPSHRTNVAATRMSLFTDERAISSAGSTAQAPWRTIRTRACPTDGSIRGVACSGEYVAAQLATAASHGRAVVRHLRDRAVEIQPQRGGWLIGLASGGTVTADLVVLAVSHPPPEPPRHLVEAFATPAGLRRGSMGGWTPLTLSSLSIQCDYGYGAVDGGRRGIAGAAWPSRPDHRLLATRLWSRAPMPPRAMTRSATSPPTVRPPLSRCCAVCGARSGRQRPPATPGRR